MWLPQKFLLQDIVCATVNITAEDVNIRSALFLSVEKNATKKVIVIQVPAYVAVLRVTTARTVHANTVQFLKTIDGPSGLNVTDKGLVIIHWGGAVVMQIGTSQIVPKPDVQLPRPTN